MFDYIVIKLHFYARMPVISGGETVLFNYNQQKQTSVIFVYIRKATAGY